MIEPEQVKDKLARLQLRAMAQNLESAVRDAAEQNLGFLTTLHRLADLELERRWLNAVKLRREQARLNEKRTIDQFDFDHHKSRKEHKSRILNLLNLEFIRERMDVILIGNPGTGKTFLAQCIAAQACNANIKVLFTPPSI